jgi:hypothetical protein
MRVSVVGMSIPAPRPETAWPDQSRWMAVLPAYRSAAAAMPAPTMVSAMPARKMSRRP